MFKKILLAINGVILGSLAFAGTMSSFPHCISNQVTVPCNTSAWDLGVQALFLKPLYSATKQYEFSSNSLKENTSDWNWGYRIEASYHFNTGNDLSMTWTHVDSDFNHSNFSEITPFVESLSIPFAVYQKEIFEQVNLLFGQYAFLSAAKSMHFFSGLQYAKIQVDSSNFYETSLPIVAPLGFVQDKNTYFKGVGPIVGVDYDYKLPYHVSLTAQASLALLYGNGYYNNSYVFLPSELVILSTYANKSSFVPSTEMKVGLKYLNLLSEGFLTIEGGYQALNYLRALHASQPGCFNCLTSSDFGLYGPYLGVKWVGYI